MQTLRLFFLIAFACLLTLHNALAAPFVSPIGYSITPAPQWVINHNASRTEDVFINMQAVDGSTAILCVSVAPAKPGDTLEQMQKNTIPVSPYSPMQFNIIKTCYEKVGNVRALLVVGTYLDGTKHVSFRDDTVLKNGKMYTFDCTSPTVTQARYAPAFDQMLHSVRWSR